MKMGMKRSSFEKLFGRFLEISCLAGLVIASVILMTKQRLPSQAVEFVRSLAESDNQLASDKSESDIGSEFDYEDTRLPGDVTPKAYDLSIAVNLSTMTFSGKVEIMVNCERSTQHVILHAKEMDIRWTNISSFKTKKNLTVKNILTKPKYDYYIIELKKPLKKHKQYLIKMSYEANISKSLHGFYKSYYTTGLGERRPLVLTHFEPMYARKAFPCFDEPAMKANFTMHISRDPTHQSLSNMPRDREENKAVDLVIDHYVTSPPMSTYLLGFMVMDFPYLEIKTDTGVPVRVYGPPGDKDKLGFALKIASKTLSFYEKLLDVPYSLKKLDIVGVPDFQMGGMEQWGLITFRRERLVFDEKFVTASTKERIMSTITHELAHMWFGDLVTMKWWNDLWLKEGFAEFFSYLACYNIDKDTDSLTLSLLTGWNHAMSEDGKPDKHPLINSAKTPVETEKILDAISYQKGAMVLKMLMNTLGNSAFRKGLRMYINARKYGSAETADLWQSLSQVGKHLNISRLMKTWAEQTSFPIVTLKRLKGPEKDIILAKQESFVEHKLQHQDVTDGKTSQHTTADQTDRKRPPLLSSPWHIPLTYMVQSTAFKEYTVWLDKKWEKLSVLDPTGWIKANVRANGYYVVNYDKANWIKLIKQLKNYHVVFSPSDRAGLIHDAFVLACEGLLDASIALKLVMYLPREDHYVPMEMLRRKSPCLEGSFKEEKIKRLYKDYLWYLQEPQLEKLGMEDDKGGLLEQLNRHSTLEYAMKHRPDVRQKFENIFQEMRDMKDQRNIPKGVSSNFRHLALTHGVNKSSTRDWEYLWKLYETTPYDSDRGFLTSTLVSFEGADLFKKNLQYSIDPGKVRTQDSLNFLSRLSSGKHKEEMLRFFTTNWKILSERFGIVNLMELVTKVSKQFKTTAELNQVKQFLNDEAKGPMDEQSYQRTLESIQGTHDKKSKQTIDTTKASKWLQRYMKKVQGNVPKKS